MIRLARGWPQRRWAVEGANGLGRSLVQRLVAVGESVVDVPTRLAPRVRVYSEGHDLATVSRASFTAGGRPGERR